MTSMTPMTAASLMADVPGCELWLVQRDLDDPDIREHLGAVQTGLTHYRLRSGRRQGWAHRHPVAT
jgi:hypothetical protein